MVVKLERVSLAEMRRDEIVRRKTERRRREECRRGRTIATGVRKHE